MTRRLRRALQTARTFMREATLGFYRARGMNALTVGIIAASFAIVGGFLVIMENLRILSEEWNRVQIHAYLNDEAAATRADEVIALIEDLRSRDIILDVRHISRDEALKIFRETFTDLAPATDLLSQNPFPASIEISVAGERGDRMESTEQILEELRGSPLISMIQDNEKDARRLAAALGIFSRIGFGIGATLAIASTFIVFNVIRLTVNARRYDITIMRLVGATPGFIRGPFLVEGMMQGILGAIIAIIVLRLAHFGLSDYASRSGSGLAAMLSARFLPLPRVLQIAFGGLLIGLIGSALSLRRFLAEQSRRAPRERVL